MAGLALFLGWLLVLDSQVVADEEYSEGVWVSTGDLLPGWGFYRNRAEYGGTTYTGDSAVTAMGDGILTWVVELPEAGVYQVWLRRYGARSNAEVLVNGELVEGGRGGPGGTEYVWRHMGEVSLDSGWHHVDLEVRSGSIVDAVVLTPSFDFSPDTDPLPRQITDPEVRAPRRYLDHSHLAGKDGGTFLVAGALADPYADHRNDLVPQTGEVLTELSAWGAAGEHLTLTFYLHALSDTGKTTVSLVEVEGPDGVVLGPEAIDVRVLHLRERALALYGVRNQGVVPDLMVLDDRSPEWPPPGQQGGFGGGRCVTEIPAGESRQIWVRVDLPPGSPPGEYRGVLTAQAAEAERALELPISFEVLDVGLQPVEGYYGSFYRARLDPERPAAIPVEQFRAELREHVRQGHNTVSLYTGSDLEGMKAMREAGMVESPLLLRRPGRDSESLIDAARELGFPGVIFWGVDEPRSPEQIETAQRVGEFAAERGLDLAMAINSERAYEQIRDHITLPILVLRRIDMEANAEAIEFANEMGFRPVSYVAFREHAPLFYRGVSGLYNTASGYHGTVPWVTQDYQRSPDGQYWMYFPDQEGAPIPSIRWEGFRHGVDDVRYLQALDRAIERAEERLEEFAPPPGLDAALAQARAAREEHFESISGRFFRYFNRMTTVGFEKARRDMAEATATINGLL